MMAPMDSNVGTTTVAMISQNDAPVLDLDANDSSGETGGNYAATFTEGGGAVLVADVDCVLFPTWIMRISNQ